MSVQEHALAAAGRWAQLEALQKHYSTFQVFLDDVMEELGFGVTEIQADIGAYIEHGPDNLMVQAQRSQAKTTIAAAYCVFALIHNPRLRILVLSAGGSQASDISTLIVRIIMTMPVLACLRPDRNAGDRSSTEAFDVHHSLKGMDKSPSVKCLGITANMQGNRADLLLADDIESSKNGLTAIMRAQLLHLTKDFTSIVQKGRIIWLGTPQSSDSIYNSLPARGVAVRIWPGRYPTVEQEKQYGDHLAPLLRRRMQADPGLQLGGGLLGDQGKPTDPVLLDEDSLQRKARDQGEAYFQLQHMLSTAMMDALRHPLKPELLVILRAAGELFPLKVVRGMERHHLSPQISADFPFVMREPHETSRDTSVLTKIWAYVDPAAGGANADETAYCVGGYLNGNIYILSIGAVPGGYEKEKLHVLAGKLARWGINGVTIEKNMGFGAFAAVFTPILREYTQCAIEDELVTGQKELRIINTLAPVMGRGSLVFTPEAIEEDNACCNAHSASTRQMYSVFYQLAKLSQQRNSLAHDDRADALEGLVRKLQQALIVDQNHDVKKLADRALLDMQQRALRSMGIAPKRTAATTLLSRFNRR